MSDVKTAIVILGAIAMTAVVAAAVLIAFVGQAGAELLAALVGIATGAVAGIAGFTSAQRQLPPAEPRPTEERRPEPRPELRPTEERRPEPRPTVEPRPSGERGAEPRPEPRPSEEQR